MRRKRGIKGNLTKLGVLCLALLLGMGSLSVGYAAWTDTLTIGGTVNTGSWSSGGTPGFWHQCIYDPALDSEHYSASQTNIWLNYIDSGGGLVTASGWLVADMDNDSDIDTDDMIAIFNAGSGGTDKEKFLRHYLATRLNVEAGRLSLGTTHDVIGISGYGYLSLATPAFASLTAIIAAIEGKEGTSPTDGQFEIMKNICDKLNNLLI